MNLLRYATVLAFVALCSQSYAVQMGSAAPKVTVYQPSDTRVIVYDARPELGIDVQELGQREFDSLSDLGIRIVHKTLQWDKMEPSDKEGLYDGKYLSEWDSCVRNSRMEGISLIVTISGEPGGSTYADRERLYRRFARFASDMAARYPSVLYWGLFDKPSATCLFGAKNDLSAVEQGKNYAELLKMTAPAVRASSPAAYVMCCGESDMPDFVQGVYEGGGGRYFDILGVSTLSVPAVADFVEYGKQVRKVMAANGDELKPLWNIGFGLDAAGIVEKWGLPHEWQPAQEDGKAFDDKQIEDCQNCLQMNNQLGLYSRVILKSLEAGCRSTAADIATLPKDRNANDFGFGILRTDYSPRPLFNWLKENAVNSAIAVKSRTIANVFVPTKSPMISVGYDYKLVEGGIEIQRVVVDSIFPTRIDLIYVSEPKQGKPGTRDSSPDGRKNTRPIPDPFDI